MQISQYKKSLVIVALVIFVIVFATPVMAEEIDIGSGINKVSNEEVSKKLLDMFKKAAYIYSAFASLCLLGVGGKFMVSRGDERKTAEAKTWLTYVIFALIIVGLALVGLGFIAWIIKT